MEPGKRFFESTRGRIVLLLRESRKTVNELAAELQLTDNAVRAHLLALEGEGLVRQSGIQPGKRKPHFYYELTGEAEQLFPKAYDVLLNQLITTLKGRLSSSELEDVLREVGRALAAASQLDRKRGIEAGLARGLTVLESIGGAAKVERDGDEIVIQGAQCPLASAVAQHPEICSLAESLLTEVIGAHVHEHCDRTTTPRCRFEIVAS